MSGNEQTKSILEMTPYELIAAGTEFANYKELDKAHEVLALLEGFLAKRQCPVEFVEVVKGAILYCENRHREAIPYLEHTVPYFAEKEMIGELLFVCNDLGNLYRELNEFHRAVYWQQYALEGREESLKPYVLGVLYNNLGNSYAKLCEFDSALEYCFKSLKIRQEAEILSGVASCWLNISEIYCRLGEIENSLEFAEKAVAFYRDEGMELQLSKALNTMGMLHKDAGNLDEAIPLLEESLEIKEKLNRPGYIHTTLHTLGLVYRKKGEFETARSYLNRALEIRKGLQDPGMVASSLLSLAYSYLEEEDFDEAMRYCALATETDIQRKELLHGMNEVMSKCLAAQGNFKDAYRYQGEAHRISLEIYKEERTAKLAEVQTRFDFETQKKEAEIYRLKNVELIEKNRQIAEQKACIEDTLNKLRMSERSLDFIHERFIEIAGRKIIGGSDEIQAVLNMVGKVAQTDNTTVLIIGESGTGKELVARAIHDASRRSKHFFHGVNSSAISSTLFESEIFGYEKGAFTGALTAKPGWFEVANGGTLFLDEIGTMPIDQQIKLLRVLEERNIIRVGARNQISVNVRIISATNQNLTELVNEGTFREDLYHRLAAFVIHIPPLRNRKNDIPILFEHYISVFSKAMNKTIRRIDPKVIETLMEYSFPGNIRELKNMAEKSVILCESSTLQAEHIQIHGAPLAKSRSTIETLNLADLEEQAVRKALDLSGGNQSAAARLLGITAKSVERRLIKYGIPTRFKAT